MGMQAHRWLMTAQGAPLVREVFVAEPAAGEVVVAIAGCGVCHTDGLLTGTAPLITLFGAPFFTGLADRTHRHKLIMGLGLAVAVGVALMLPHLSSFPVVFALIIIFNIFMSPVGPLSDSATMTMLGEQRAMYGRIRMGGSFGWGIFALISGALVENYGLQIAFRLFAVIMFGNLLVSQKFSFGLAGRARLRAPPGVWTFGSYV